MFVSNNLPKVIPIFPLSGALLLPRSNLPLQIFEPKYLQMLEDSLKTSDRMIGMIQVNSNTGNPNDLHKIGCAGRIIQFSETPDGRYMITLAGVSRFQIEVEEIGFTAYRKAQVDWSDFETDLGPAEKDKDFDRDYFMELLEKFFVSADLKTDWNSLKDADEELLINSLSILCPFEAEDKQALLEAKSLVLRRKTLTTLLEFSILGGRAGDSMQ
ncbi:MAG: LON peptidase substrate-binding domain-containing protein [Paracoccaceae bacterium]